ncbi:hypothetical protein P4159_02900 [Bacillus thuringiensis]|uniref:hypothetical protein n=1 Tax=Bacillus thuringiensis TaxID=1428 RepID=UPI0007C1A207|nr:hypothetical protein [Bacillus thuringiensis]AND11101.1 hypothetical protein Bt4C1_28310 [Bacillus thuringiensis serovar alesti]MEC3597929.1 hypothetical protein [Bacillus thuringiensis]MED1837333.1 hypothetical protein [Bacillus thuringiensis]MED2209095.1 hypothetical protein [Bacillus thuringiensis]MED2670171.1 hypothetical protein [Bacillus thuringiensis]
MSQVPGFLKFVLAKERRYVYLVVAEKKNKKVHTHMLYGFGPLEKALETMYEMRDDFENLFPLELKERGYDWEDINNWILSIETGYSKHGNKLVIY